MSRVRRRDGKRKQTRLRLRFGASDPSLTGHSGLAAVSALCDRLGIIRSLDRCVGAWKERDRGLSAGRFLVGLACAQLLGVSAFAGLDRLRLGTAGQRLAPARCPLPAARCPPARTGLRLAGRFGPKHVAGVEASVAELIGRWLPRLPVMALAGVP